MSESKQKEIVDSLIEFYQDCDMGRVEKLLNGVSNINETDRLGFTMLRYACEKNDDDVIKCLIDRGADVCVGSGDSPLMLMVEKGNLGMLKYALEYKKVKVDEFELKDLLPIAVRERKKDIIEYLLGYGLDINQRNSSSYTPLMYACRIGIDMVNFLFEKGKNLDVNVCSSIGWTALHYAVAKGKVDVVKKLIENGAYVNKKNINGDNPFMLACEIGDKEIIECLMDKVENLNDVNKKGETALFIAVKNEKIDAVKTLLKKGEILKNIASEERDIDEEIPLFHAIECRYYDIVRCLLEKGANANIKRGQKTPLKAVLLAEREEDRKMVEDLVKYGAKVDKEVIEELKKNLGKFVEDVKKYIDNYDCDDNLKICKIAYETVDYIVEEWKAKDKSDIKNEMNKIRLEIDDIEKYINNKKSKKGRENKENGVERIAEHKEDKSIEDKNQENNKVIEKVKKHYVPADKVKLAVSRFDDKAKEVFDEYKKQFGLKEGIERYEVVYKRKTKSYRVILRKSNGFFEKTAKRYDYKKVNGVYKFEAVDKNKSRGKLKTFFRVPYKIGKKISRRLTMKVTDIPKENVNNPLDLGRNR